jgi:hypothetical protein
LSRGRKIIVYYNDGNRNNRTYSVRAVVDDDVIIVRNEDNKEDIRAYAIEHRGYLEYMAEKGFLFK